MPDEAPAGLEEPLLETRQRPALDATGPRLLLLDEVTGGVDAMVRINAEGVSILFIEQNVELALSLAHRGYVLESGRTVLEGRSAELLRSPEVRRIFLGG